MKNHWLEKNKENYVTWVEHKKFQPDHKHENEILVTRFPSGRIFQHYVPRKGKVEECNSEGMLSSRVIADHSDCLKPDNGRSDRENEWLIADRSAELYFWNHIKPEYKF